MTKDALVLNDVAVAYGSLVAVEDVSFTVKNGDFFCVVGANGSGKSTLVKGILGLLPLLRGHVATGQGKEKMSWVPQDETRDRKFPATVLEIVLTGTQRSGRRLPFYTKADRRAAEESMELFGISSLRNRKTGELSGGQRRRVLLARAMCRGPSLLLLDEPCAGLDAETKAAFYATLRRLNRENGLSVVMITHDPGDVEACATHVVELARRPLFIGNLQTWKETFC